MKTPNQNTVAIIVATVGIILITAAMILVALGRAA